jgi:serine phosphatase RsbU (regulator of sigma subunit)
MIKPTWWEVSLRGPRGRRRRSSHTTLWCSKAYGVYLQYERQLRYCAGGHHPGYLVSPARGEATPLWTRNVMLGAQVDYEYREAAYRAREL